MPNKSISKAGLKYINFLIKYSVGLPYKPYFFDQSIVFLSHNKSVDNIFNHNVIFGFRYR